MRPGLSPSRQQRLPAAVLALLFVYWCVYVFSLSFVLGGQRYFTLLDDQMISMRYASHIASGHGAAWNIGESPVEGFSNPLWMGAMTLVHLGPFSAAHVSLVVQLLSVVVLGATLWVGLVLLEEIIESRAHPFATVGFLVLAGTYAPILSWVLQGSEVGLVSLLIVASATVAVRSVSSGRFSALPHVIAAIASLVRVDAAVPALAISGWMILRQPELRWRHLKVVLPVIGAALGIQTLLRLWIFGTPLPNTYYLKLTGFPIVTRLARGTVVFGDFVASALIVIAAAVAACKKPERLALLGVFCSCALYSIYVGGDAWEEWGGSNRYLTPAMPLLFVLAAASVDRLARIRPMGDLAALVALLLMFITANGFAQGRGLRVISMKEKPLGAEAAQATVALGIALRNCTAADSRIAVDWAGAIPYFSERHTEDLLAKSDPVVAREPMHLLPSAPLRTQFWPGHLKWDFERSIAMAKPDVVIVLTAGFPERVQPYLARYATVGHLEGGVVAVRDGVSGTATVACINDVMERQRSLPLRWTSGGR